MKPWSFEPKSSKLTVFFGSDLAMSLSLARSYNAIFLEKCNPEILYESSLFDNLEPIKTMIEGVQVDKFIKMHKKCPFTRSCIIVSTVNDIQDDPELCLIKSEPLNSRSREWFISHQSKRLKIEPPQHSGWINNLDDLKFADLLEQFELQYPLLETERSIWSEIRINLLKAKGDIAAIWHHFELWAKENSASDESLYFFYKSIEDEITSLS